ncbi:MAG: hypothetical protein ACREVJ_12030, partial [Gammaproteobacteria bacterium]
MRCRLVLIRALAVVLLGSTTSTPAQQASQDEIKELKRALERQEQSIRGLKLRLNELEGRTQPAPPSPAHAPAPVVTKPG